MHQVCTANEIIQSCGVADSVRLTVVEAEPTDSAGFVHTSPSHVLSSKWDFSTTHSTRHDQKPASSSKPILDLLAQPVRLNSPPLFSRGPGFGLPRVFRRGSHLLFRIQEQSLEGWLGSTTHSAWASLSTKSLVFC